MFILHLHYFHRHESGEELQGFEAFVWQTQCFYHRLWEVINFMSREEENKYRRQKRVKIL